MAGNDFVRTVAHQALSAGYRGGHLCMDVMIIEGELGVEADKIFHVVVSAFPDNGIYFGNARTEVVIHDGIKHCCVN